MSLDSSDARVSVGATAEPDELARQKRAAADCAVEHVRSGMVVGLGAGSTALFAIARIAERIAERRLVDVTGVPCSRDAGEAAARLGIQIGTLNDYPAIDLTIDGADEVDPDLDLIKGAGGPFCTKRWSSRPVDE